MDFAHETTDTQQLVRKRKSFAAARSVSSIISDWLIIVLAGLPVFLGPVFFGAVRLWSIGPMLIAVFLGGLIALLRRNRFGSDKHTFVPIGGLALLGILLFVAVLSMRSVVPYESKIEWLKTASYVSAYWIWTDVTIRKGRWRRLLGAFLFLSTLIAWYALIQHARGSKMVLAIPRPDVYGMRASGTFICPNHFAALLEIALTLAFVLVLCKESSAPLRLFSGYALIICLPVLFLTMSRSGWLGAVAGISVAVLSVAWRRGVRTVLSTLIAGGVVVVSITVAAWRLSPMVRERIRGASLEQPDPAVAARLETWRDTLTLIRAAPMWGHGPGTYVWTFPRFKKTDQHLLFNYAHNEYLHGAADYGVVGLLLLAGSLIWIAARCANKIRRVRRDRDAYVASGFLGVLTAQAVHAFFDFNLHIFSIVHALAFLGGVVIACFYTSEELTPLRLSGRKGNAVLAIAAIAITVCLVLAGQVYASYGFHRLGEKRWQRLDLEGAERYFRLSKRVDPGNWRAYQGLGHVFRTRALWNWDDEEKRRYGLCALAEYEQAWARNPLDLETRYAMATVYNALGNSEKALELLREVVSKNPTHLFYLNRLGLQLRQMGRYEEALQVFKNVQQRWGTSMAGLNIRYLEEEIKKAQSTQSER